VAGAAMATGALLLTTLAQHTPLAYLLAAYGVFGAGLGTVNAPITNTAVSAMPRSRAALASAVASTSRQVGASLGVALAGSLAGAGIESAQRSDFVAATHLVFWVIAGLGIAIVVLGLVSTGARARGERAASRSLARCVAGRGSQLFSLPDTEQTWLLAGRRVTVVELGDVALAAASFAAALAQPARRLAENRATTPQSSI